MTADVKRDEFDRLEGRVDVLEREVDGEKLVTRHILEQTRRNGDDLAAIKTRLDRIEGRTDSVEGRLGRVEGRLDGVERRLDRVEGRLGHVEREVRSLREDMPGIVGDAVRSALREQKA